MVETIKTIIGDKEKSKMYTCCKCGRELPDNQLFNYVDDSNIAITKNSKDYCWRCYNEVYPNDKISIKQALQCKGYRAIINSADKTIYIASPENALKGSWSIYSILDKERIIKDFDL